MGNRRKRDDQQSPVSKASSSKKIKSNMTWSFRPLEKVHVGVFNDSKPSHKLACFDFDSTLSVTKTGKVFPKDGSDCKLFHPSLPTLIRAKHDEGYRFVIFTNQLGILAKKTTVEDVKSRISIILEEIGAPCIVFASVSKNNCRKPVDGMFKLLIENYNDDKEVSLTESFYVGDAAGRPKTKDRSKDHSDADYLFALNTGLPFILPEQFIAKKNISDAAKLNSTSLTIARFHPSRFNPEGKPLAIDLLAKKEFKSMNDLRSDLKSKKKDSRSLLIVMIGLPGSGKSTLAKKLFPDGQIISRDVVGTMAKCEKHLVKLLDQGTEIIIVDNTNLKQEERSKWINLSKGKKASLVAVHVNTDIDHCLHNSCFRTLAALQQNPETDESKLPSVPSFVIKNMLKNFVKPTKSEGFDAIYEVALEPKIEDAALSKLYFQYLF